VTLQLAGIGPVSSVPLSSCAPTSKIGVSSPALVPVEVPSAVTSEASLVDGVVGSSDALLSSADSDDVGPPVSDGSGPKQPSGTSAENAIARPTSSPRRMDIHRW
jgi:hypothetical protein